MPGDPLRAQVDRGDVPRRRHLLQRGARHVRLHRHLARTAASRCRAPAWASRRWRSTPTSCSASTTSQTIVRVGSCGALTEKLAVRDIVHRLRRLHRLVDEPDPLRGPRLRPGRRLRPAPRGVDAAQGLDHEHAVHVGLIFSQRLVLRPRPELTARMVEYGVLAVEMEASALYTLAAKYGRRALCDLHRHRPHRHRRGDDRRGARADLRHMVEIALGARRSVRPDPPRAPRARPAPGSVGGSTSSPVRT